MIMAVAAIIDKAIISNLPIASPDLLSEEVLLILILLIFDLLGGRNRYPNDQGAYQTERFSSVTAQILN